MNDLTKILDFKNSDAGDLNDKSRYVTPTELADIYCGFIKNYPIVSIEDPFDQDRMTQFVQKIFSNGAPDIKSPSSLSFKFDPKP